MPSTPRRARWPRRSKGADVFFGLSAKGAVTQEMVETHGREARSSSPWPIPIPEITPEEVPRCATTPSWPPGRSDYPNQINNVLGFPYIFRGALDVRAQHDQRGDEDRRGARPRRTGARRRARRGRRGLSGARLRYGPDYIIPAPFDPRLI